MDLKVIQTITTAKIILNAAIIGLITINCKFKEVIIANRVLINSHFAKRSNANAKNTVNRRTERINFLLLLKNRKDRSKTITKINNMLKL